MLSKGVRADFCMYLCTDQIGNQEDFSEDNLRIVLQKCERECELAHVRDFLPGAELTE